MKVASNGAQLGGRELSVNPAMAPGYTVMGRESLAEHPNSVNAFMTAQYTVPASLRFKKVWVGSASTEAAPSEKIHW